MKTISLWQPWASLMVILLKKIETRSWYTDYRGPLTIHAAKKVVTYLPPIFYQDGSGNFIDFPLGAIVGVCILNDCVQITEDNIPSDLLEREFGDYTPGRFMWVTKNMKKFNRPIPTIGYQRIWNWDWERTPVKGEAAIWRYK